MDLENDTRNSLCLIFFSQLNTVDITNTVFIYISNSWESSISGYILCAQLIQKPLNS